MPGRAGDHESRGKNAWIADIGDIAEMPMPVGLLGAASAAFSASSSSLSSMTSLSASGPRLAGTLYGAGIDLGGLVLVGGLEGALDRGAGPLTSNGTDANAARAVAGPNGAAIVGFTLHGEATFDGVTVGSANAESLVLAQFGR